MWAQREQSQLPPLSRLGQHGDVVKCRASWGPQKGSGLGLDMRPASRSALPPPHCVLE